MRKEYIVNFQVSFTVQSGLFCTIIEEYILNLCMSHQKLIFTALKT